MGELLSIVAHEITGDPTKYAIELVQFGLLVAIVWMVAVGVGRRKGVVVKMLEKHQDRIGAEIARTKSADGVLDAARVRATETSEAGRVEAAAIITEAKRVARAVEGGCGRRGGPGAVPGEGRARRGTR
jgi:F0F1-type ATP synthase membrane subunit b/b'